MHRPPSTIRPSSGGFQVPGSRALGSRAGVGFDPHQMAGVGAGLNTQLQVTVRPVTNQGMAGQKGGTAGPGRQVADRSYFLGLLRTKNGELMAELERLKQQEDQLTKSSTALPGLELKQKELEKELSALKETLNDYNFSVSQAKVDPVDMNSERERLKEHNALTSKSVDEVFLQVKGKEAEAKKIEAAIQAQLDEVETKLNAEPEKRKQYIALREESTQLREELVPKQKELEVLQRRYTTMTHTLKADTARQAVLKLQDRHKTLEKTKNDLLDEIKASPNGKLQDEKTRLLNQVKADTAELDSFQRQIDETKERVRNKRESLLEMETHLKEYTGERAEKYKELEAKDLEMQGLIDKFDVTKQDALADIAKSEEKVVRLLETIAKHLQFMNQMPSQQQAKEMAGDLDFKKKQLEFSMTTHERLKNELDLRKKELEKVENLDTKISGELEAITQKILQHEESTQTYSNLEALRQASDQRRRDLQVQRGRLIKRSEVLKTLVQNLTQNKHDPLKASVTENELYASLHTQEQKIRLIQQNVFALADFIAQKGNEADYMPIKAQCMKLVEDINKHIQDHLIQK